MPYDLFISYARRDDQPPDGEASGRVGQLVERIRQDFAAYSSVDRPLRVFFDRAEIQGMNDWRARILEGLRESHLLLACLSPAYLDSPYCEWELTEYLKHEVARHVAGQGVAPIYFVPIPGWDERDFEARSASWVRELRTRQAIDLRPWFRQGEQALQEAAVQARIVTLNAQIRDRVQRGERAARSQGNVDAANLHFVGRVPEMRRLREAVALGQLGVVTAVHGLGGMGKTALAIEYAHAYADQYGGGRWQLRCEGQINLALLLKATNRLAEAEPLYRQAVAILERFTRDTGHEHPNLRIFRANLAQARTAQRQQPALWSWLRRWLGLE